MPHWCILLSLYHSILFIILFYISKFKSQVIHETLPKCPQKGGGGDYLNASVLWRVVLFYHSCMLFFRIGRKKTLILSVLCLLASSLAVSWAADFYLFCVLRFIVGFSCAGLFMSAFVLGDYLIIWFLLYRIFCCDLRLIRIF